MTNERAREIITTTVSKLREQGCFSSNGSTCRYRGPNDVKCAAGFWISDECYSESIEGMSIARAFSMSEIGSSKSKIYSRPLLRVDYQSLKSCIFFLIFRRSTITTRQLLTIKAPHSTNVCSRWKNC